MKKKQQQEIKEATTMRSQTPAEMWSRLPEDIHLDIPIRVQARSTYACKCVCTTWSALISDPSFIKKHLELTLGRDKPSLMICGRRYLDKMHLITEHDSKFGSEVDAVEVDNPFEDEYVGVELLGTCNGLVALFFDDDLSNEIICIWNPVTRATRILPKSPNEVLQEEISICALGYASDIDDYKLVKVVPLDRPDEGNSADIYTLGDNSWRTIRRIPYRFPFDRTPGVLVHGNLHWLGETRVKDVSQVIVSFDISDEMFREILLPKESLESKYLLRSVGLLERCLCVVANVVNVGITIWVMQEYGTQESWTKQYVIGSDSFANYEKDILVFLNEYKYLRSFKNGEILFGLPNTLVIYDPQCGSLRDSNILTPSAWYAHDNNYIESLVPLECGGGRGRGSLGGRRGRGSLGGRRGRGRRAGGRGG